MINNIKIALAQLEFEFGAVEHNIRIAGEAIKKPAELGNDLFCFQNYGQVVMI